MLNLDSALAEVAEYLGQDVEELKKKYQEVAAKYDGYLKWTKVTDEEWKSRNINEQNSKEVMNFYATTPNYMIELMEYHATEDKQRLTQTVVDYTKEKGKKTIVDFGAGVAQDSIMAAQAGLVATAADIPGQTFDFAKWRIKKYGVNVKTVDILKEEPLVEKYDAISCFEVLQHIVDPVRTLKHFHQHLNQGGLLFITTRFRGNYSLALTHNEKFEDNFSQVVQDNGFELVEKIHQWGPKEGGKYLYVYAKK